MSKGPIPLISGSFCLKLCGGLDSDSGIFLAEKVLGALQNCSMLGATVWGRGFVMHVIIGEWDCRARLCMLQRLGLFVA